MTIVDTPVATLYERVGGEPFFRRLVGAFYDGVATDPVLLRLYPEAPDLTGARERLRMFLVQYWGGPTTYSDQRGHPRLRLRHMPFHIGREERARWLEHMTAAIDVAVGDLDGELADAVREQLLGYFVPGVRAVAQRHRTAHQLTTAVAILRTRSGSAIASISTILPSTTVKPITANGRPASVTTTPAAPFTSAGCSCAPAGRT